MLPFFFPLLQKQLTFSHVKLIPNDQTEIKSGSSEFRRRRLTVVSFQKQNADSLNNSQCLIKAEKRANKLQVEINQSLKGDHRNLLK